MAVIQLEFLASLVPTKSKKLMISLWDKQDTFGMHTTGIRVVEAGPMSLSKEHQSLLQVAQALAEV